jgi:2-C-methyl-D-erythritol 4-phosphate cytidylyltransferase
MSYYALVPAAGSGSRMGTLTGRALPKQYLPLAGKPLIWHALSTLCATPAIRAVFVVLAPDDSHWPAGDNRWANDCASCAAVAKPGHRA